MSVLAVLLLGSAGVLRAAAPSVTIQQDSSGAKITWNASDGRDYVLEASDDFATWVQVNQSVVKEGDLHRVFVPSGKVKSFYRLANDGVRTHAAYVGSQTCQMCHSSIYSKFIDHGHGYKMNQVVDGNPPTYFSGQEEHVATPPANWNWPEVSWVIGGALWKARFIDQNGYIVTGTDVQLNLATGGWSGYHPENAIGTKPYDCGRCHTTGWVSVDDGGVHQDGMSGMLGSFAAPGVQCEACHGPGSRHVTASSDRKSEIIKDTSAAQCGACHIRGSSDTIPASGGFIRHHETYNEILSAGHKNHDCTTCHDPHVSAARGLGGAIIKACTDCHSTTEYAQNFHSEFTDCVTCHMPQATKSAVAVNKYTADIRTHIFRINPAADGQMFTADGKFANGSTGVTLGYACFQCHQDPDGIGGDAPTKTLTELSAEATGFHH